ncbi:helix-turn-helix domain-containing protein [Catenulispora subtropica]|uniref:Winged helix-turn-helix domain-containing protein n=1 Tax=Catenulispora subtropica TaxID=450798 RepID=A0ABP5CL04_9ACTN
MLSFHFETGDFARVRFPAKPAPLVELKLSLMMTRRSDSAVVFGRWRRDVNHRLPPTTRPLWDLLESHRGPAFLDPLTSDLEEGLEVVRSTPGAVVRSDVAGLRRLPSPWVKALMARDTQAWEILDRGLRDAYRSVMGPAWTGVRERHSAEFARFALGSAEHGVAAALSALYPTSTWQASTWHIPAFHTREVHLAGRGLTLLPTFHWTYEPLIGAWPDRPPLLVYPAGPGLPVPTTQPEGDPLADVLGSSRARILRLLARPHTTTELATDAGLSLGTTSSHSSALRRAGLITTRREGRSVQHLRTELGRMLAEAGLSFHD